jgi:predicted aconitase with swiveling domain
MVDTTKATVHCHKGVGGVVTGEACVTHDPISFFADVDWRTGEVKTKEHELYGKNVSGKILVYPIPKGGIAAAWTLYEMVKRGCAPKAIINARTNPATLQGAIIGKIPLVDRLETNPLEVIQTGDLVTVKPDEGVVEIVKRS